MPIVDAYMHVFCYHPLSGDDWVNFALSKVL